jgi:hypothetical protein
MVIGSPDNIVTMVEPDVSFSHPWDETAVLVKGRENPVSPVKAQLHASRLMLAGQICAGS